MKNNFIRLTFNGLSCQIQPLSLRIVWYTYEILRDESYKIFKS